MHSFWSISSWIDSLCVAAILMKETSFSSFVSVVVVVANVVEVMLTGRSENCEINVKSMYFVQCITFYSRF